MNCSVGQTHGRAYPRPARSCGRLARLQSPSKAGPGRGPGPFGHADLLSFLARVRRFAWPLAWLAWSLPILAFLALRVPPWQNSDEPTHLLRAVEIAHGEWLAHRAFGTAGGLSDPAIYTAYLPLRPVSMHPSRAPTDAERAASERVDWSARPSFVPFANTAQYAPFFYLPDALAYRAGRAAGLRVDGVLRLARLLNALTFAALGGLALGLAGRTRPALAAILMLPMTLSLGASAAQDGPMIGATALAVALIERDGRLAGLAGGLLAACGMARPPYIGHLLALGALPWRRRWLWIGASALPVLLWSALVAHHVSVRLGQADWQRQLSWLLADPGSIPRIAIATVWNFTPNYAEQFIGRLGWTDTPLPRAYLVVAGLLLVPPYLAAGRSRPRAAGLVAAGVAVSVLSIFVLQYLTWTWPGQPFVTGVLGRYFLPPALVLLLAMPELAPRLRGLAVPCLVAAGVITPPVVLHAIAARYGG